MSTDKPIPKHTVSFHNLAKVSNLRKVLFRCGIRPRCAICGQKNERI